MNDAVPAKLLEQWRNELNQARRGSARDHQSRTSRALIGRIRRFEDSGHGACVLRDPVCADHVAQALRYHHDTRYRLIEWCIMPNHVHVIFTHLPGHTLGQIIKTWKSFTATQINRHLKRQGRLWMPDYFDRYIRDEDHLADARAYVRNNPVKAGLCARPEDWPHGSA